MTSLPAYCGMVECVSCMQLHWWTDCVSWMERGSDMRLYFWLEWMTSEIEFFWGLPGNRALSSADGWSLEKLDIVSGIVPISIKRTQSLICFCSGLQHTFFLLSWRLQYLGRCIKYYRHQFKAKASFKLSKSEQKKLLIFMCPGWFTFKQYFISFCFRSTERADICLTMTIIHKSDTEAHTLNYHFSTMRGKELKTQVWKQTATKDLKQSQEECRGEELMVTFESWKADWSSIK